MGSRFRVAEIAHDHNMHEKSEDLPTGGQRVVAAEKDDNVEHHDQGFFDLQLRTGAGYGDGLCSSRSMVSRTTSYLHQVEGPAP